jgi:putative GTP pyrophosphokinase
VCQYRAAHQYPLIKANMGLRSAVRTVGCRVEVSQRLKRFRAILDKLVREPKMGLPTMQDIGGCRAVLGSIEEIRRVERRLRKNPILRYADYITTPRPSGYRGIHVVVGYSDRDGEERAIEVQLRAPMMHEWAIMAAIWMAARRFAVGLYGHLFFLRESQWPRSSDGCPGLGSLRSAAY